MEAALYIDWNYKHLRDLHGIFIMFQKALLCKIKNKNW